MVDSKENDKFDLVRELRKTLTLFRPVCMYFTSENNKNVV